MSEIGIVKYHFGPETGLPVPRITDAQIAMETIINNYGISTEDMYKHPIDAEQIVDKWPDEGLPE